jgi:DNA-binding GntR family transcriptional regulator
MTASDRAYEYAKTRILDGRFGGGELISEGDVAAPIGLSRTPVREAFLRLRAEGLLRLYPKRGALVVPVSAAEVESVIETRLVIERFAVARAAGRGSELAPELERTIAAQEAMVEGGERSAFVAADREFHRSLLDATGNPLLLELYDSLRDRQSRMGLVAIARQADRMETIVIEHRELCAAISAGDASAAEAILERHLQGTLRALRGSSLST